MNKETKPRACEIREHLSGRELLRIYNQRKGSR